MRVSAVFIVTQLTTVPAATFNGIAHIDQRADRRAMGRISVADAQFDFKDYELTDVCFDCLRPTPDEMYNCTLKFNWYDPNSKLENDITNCSCSTSWHWDGVAATQGPRNNYNIDTYDICFRGPETFFEMKVTNFVHGKFSLSMAHRYKDSQYVNPYSGDPSRSHASKTVANDSQVTSQSLGYILLRSQLQTSVYPFSAKIKKG